MKHQRFFAAALILCLMLSLGACSRNSGADSSARQSTTQQTQQAEAQPMAAAMPAPASAEGQLTKDLKEPAYIEYALNLANESDVSWTYDQANDVWVMGPVSTVAFPELPEQQSILIRVPGAYVTGPDTAGDGAEDPASSSAARSVSGPLNINYEAAVTSTCGQTYTAATAPVILTTGGTALSTGGYAAEGYIHVDCGSASSLAGGVTRALADWKAAVRFIKYNILLGNLPGSVEHLAVLGGDEALLLAATADHPDFFDYQIEAGAVGVYRQEDGSYSTSNFTEDMQYEISEGVWGCIAEPTVGSLYEGDMALAFEYSLDPNHEFATPFQSRLADHLSQAYMDYINGRGLTAAEAQVGMDLNGNGALEDTVELTIQRDVEAYPETNGYYGTYLELYLAQFRSELQRHLNGLDRVSNWTWFDENGGAMSDEDVASMTAADRAKAFLSGRYAPENASGTAESRIGDIGGNAAMTTASMSDESTGTADGTEQPAEENGQNGETTEENGQTDEAAGENGQTGETAGDNGQTGENGQTGNAADQNGSTRTGETASDSRNYGGYTEMVAAYETDIDSIASGDQYGRNIGQLYDPLGYIGSQDAGMPVWVRLGTAIDQQGGSLLSSLNLQLAMLQAGTDCTLQWRWGSRVSDEAVYIDQMYGRYANGTEIELPDAQPQTANGTAQQAAGTDMTGWVDFTDPENVTFTLSAAAAYRTQSADLPVPGLDQIDYGPVNYLFGTQDQPARHFAPVLLDIFRQNAAELEPLFAPRQ